MGRTIGWLLLAACCGAGCGAESNAGSGASAPGGKGDVGGDAAFSPIVCEVVEVHDDNILEESLGSIYDVGPEGFLQADGDSLTVRIRKSAMSKLDSGLIGGIGQYNFGLHDAGDVLTHEPESVVGEQPVDTWKMRLADTEETFTVRIFTANGLGVVLYDIPDETTVHLATLDCRGHEEPDYEADASEAVEIAEPRCQVVAVMDDLMEEGLGSAYDIDPEGYFQSDEDSTSVSVYPSDLSELPSGIIAGIGQYSFGLHDANDKVERIEEDTGISDYRYQSYRLQLAGWDVTFTVRIFLPLELGMVFYQPSDVRGPTELLPLAAIDCRDLPPPSRD